MNPSQPSSSDPLRVVRSFALLMAILLATPVVITLKSPPPTATAGEFEPGIRPQVQARDQPTSLPASTAAIQVPIPALSIAMIEALEALGLDDGADGPVWSRSGFDGAWSTVLRRADGPNEISCMLASTRPDNVETAVLEIEIRDAETDPAPLLEMFSHAIAIVYPEATPPLFRAVEAHRPWRSLTGKLSVGPLERGGHELRLTVDRTPDAEAVTDNAATTDQAPDPTGLAPAVGSLPVVR